jgi:hypothetical protein
MPAGQPAGPGPEPAAHRREEGLTDHGRQRRRGAHGPRGHRRGPGGRLVSKRKAERRAAEAELAAREAEILRKAGTIEPRPVPRVQPAPAPAPRAGEAAAPLGPAAPAAHGEARAAARRPQAQRPVPTPGARVPADLQQAFSAALAAVLAARTAWDEPPVLYTVHRARGRGTCRLQPLRLPSGISWSSGRPHEVILGIALTISASVPFLVPPGLLGVAVRAEAWALLDEDMTPDQRQRAAAGHPDRPSRSPNRIEARVIHGIDTAGTAYHVQQLRSGRQQAFTSAPGSETAVMGLVPDALRVLLTTITGRQPRAPEPEP